MKKYAYYFDGFVSISINEVQEVVADFIQDWAKRGKGPIKLPVITKGTFEGYINENGFPIGIFTEEITGRVFACREDEEVVEVA